MPSGTSPPKGIVATVTVLFVISFANNMRMLANSTVRTVDYISIFATGVLAGVLLAFLIFLLRNKKETP